MKWLLPALLVVLMACTESAPVKETDKDATVIDDRGRNPAPPGQVPDSLERKSDSGMVIRKK